MIICPQCQAENPKTRKFCKECGVKLVLICTKCRHENLPGDKFCGECGESLLVTAVTTPKELSFDEKLQKIQKYLPGGLTEKILAQRGKIEGEHRQVTVLFADMENFTPLVEKLGPEEAYAIMDQVYEILIHKIHDFEGTVNEMTGDGVMALFGAPIALEDAPQRAIRSALAIHQEIARFSDKMKQEKGTPQIKMRIGIHTGPVVVGTLGNDLRVEFKAVGDTVNLASRIQNLAAAGTTYVSEVTFKLTEGLFRFESLGEKVIKGKEMPVGIYQVIAPSSRRTRFDVNAESGLTPFVGRVRELENLLDGLDRVKAGRGQAFSLVGEAGVGKSRLLYEFRKAISSEDIAFLEGKCLSYGRGTAYHPIIDILKSTFIIHETDDNAKIREKLTNGLEILKVDAASALPYLLDILSIKDSGVDNIPLSPEGKKDRLIEILKQIILKGSETHPLVMVIEDLHWVDKSTEDALRYFLESIPGAKIMLIFTYRPEFEHTWGRKSFHNQLTLNRLSNRESMAMAGNLLATAQVDSQIEELILSRTEGIPFFIEEHIKALKDLKIIERQNGSYKLTKSINTITIPSTIQDVIMARVDALQEGAKEVLRTGSVIEREFSYDLIRQVMDIPEQELLTRLSILKDSELLYERGIHPRTSYIFRHALTQEVVYNSILARKKKDLHDVIGQAFEKLHQDNRDPYSGVLAKHFIASENYEKGAEYSKLSAKKAMKTASIPDAISYTQQRVACLEKLPLTDDRQKKIIDARTTLAFYFAQLNNHIEAREAIDPIIDSAVKQDNKKRLCQIKIILGNYYRFVEEDFPAALGAYEEGLKMAGEVADYITLALASNWIGQMLADNCEFEKASHHMQTSLDINIAGNNLVGIAVMKGLLAVWCHLYSGKIKSGFQVSSEAVSIAEESGDIFSKGFAYTSYGVLFYAKGFPEDAEKCLLKSIEYLERIHEKLLRTTAHGCLAMVYFDIGNYIKSKDHYEKVGWLMAHSNVLPSWVRWAKVGSARAQVMSNQKNVDINILYEIPSLNKIKVCEGWIARDIGEVLMHVDDRHMPDALVWIGKAIEADSTNGMRWQLALDHALYANWYKKKGDPSGAKDQLATAIGIFRECGSDGWVEKYEKELQLL